MILSGAIEGRQKQTVEVDYVEDGDIAEYGNGVPDAYAADDGSSVSLAPIDGGWSIVRANGGNVSGYSGYEKMWSTSGLPNYPQPGDAFEMKVSGNQDPSTGTFCQTAILWGIQDGSNHYELRLEWYDDQFLLFENGGAGLLDWVEPSRDMVAGEVALIRVEWDDGSTFGGSLGDIHALLYTEDKSTLLADIPVQNSTAYTDQSGFGIRSYNADSTTVEQAFDTARITNR